MNDIEERAKVVSMINSVLVQIDPDLQQLPETAALCGANSVIDSVGLVSFLVSLEAALDHRIDLSELFLNQGDADNRDSPFATISSLADTISRSLQR